MESEFGIKLEMANFASSQTFELWKNGTTGKYSVHYLFNQELKGVFELDYFKNKLENKTYDSDKIKEICFSKSTNNLFFIQKIKESITRKNIIIYISIASLIFLLISGFLFKLYHKNNDIKNNNKTFIAISHKI